MNKPAGSFFWKVLWLGVLLVILDLVSFCLQSTVMVRTRKLREPSLVKDLEIAIKSFKTEYNHFPSSETGAPGTDLAADSTSGRMMGALLGDDLRENPKGLVFIEPPIAKEGKGGLVGQRGTHQLLDTWGKPYRVIIDADGDNKVRNPDRENSDPAIRSAAPEWLPTAVVAYSSGMDGVPQTADDIVSWRSSPPYPLPSRQIPGVMGWIGALLIVIGFTGILRSRNRGKNEDG